VQALRGLGLQGLWPGRGVMKSFFSLLQKNVLNRSCWQTREELRLAIVV
jgi:putative transposase